MQPDAIDLRDFYDSRLGQMARRMIRRKISMLWPNVKNQRILGLGFASPYLRPFLGHAERVIAAMPASQGVINWPLDRDNLTVLVHKHETPFPDAFFDKVILVHSLEATAKTRQLLREAWRVLKPNGRLLVITPNRRGIWARLDKTPFGHGHPYSTTQLALALRESMFTPLIKARALYMPPTAWSFIFRTAPLWEKIGGRFFRKFAGVLLMEASKQVYATHPPLLAEKDYKRAKVSVSSNAYKERQTHPDINKHNE